MVYLDFLNLLKKLTWEWHESSKISLQSSGMLDKSHGVHKFMVFVSS